MADQKKKTEMVLVFSFSKTIPFFKSISLFQLCLLFSTFTFKATSSLIKEQQDNRIMESERTKVYTHHFAGTQLRCLWQVLVAHKD